MWEQNVHGMKRLENEMSKDRNVQGMKHPWNEMPKIFTSFQRKCLGTKSSVTNSYCKVQVVDSGQKIIQ